jgi:drug/metabolite transporter (DMT)-like permease
LAAALLHATWNAVLRGGRDRLWSITVMSFATTAVAIPWAILAPLPAPPAWPWIAVSAILQVGYSIFLVEAYRFGDLGQVYPVARGTAPLLVTLAAAVLAQERPGGQTLAGILLVSIGVIGLTSRLDAASRRSILLATVTGAFIAAYTTVDGIGARRAGEAGSYAAWLFLLYGALMPAWFFAIRGIGGAPTVGAETYRAVAGGVLSLVTYATVIFALTRAPIGAVSALRETSVVFAALLGYLFVGERLTARRLFACTVIAIGAACIGWRS